MTSSFMYLYCGQRVYAACGVCVWFYLVLSPLMSVFRLQQKRQRKAVMYEKA